MGVKAGYKRTELGLIPEDWDLLEFDETCRRLNGKAHQIQTSEYATSGAIPVIDQGQVPIVGYSDSTSRAFRVPDGGVLVFGDHTCIVKFVNFDFIVGADGTQLIATKPGQCTRFRAYDLEHNGISSTGYNRHFKFLRERKFVSPSEAEQRAIADALSDVDALLEGLDRLIAKKRQVRNATKRQLLAGDTRLPGFAEQWTRSSFANVVRHHAGNSTLIKGKLPSSGAAGLYPAYSASGQDVWCEHFEHEGHAVVVSAVGSRCGKAFPACGKWSAIANTHVVWPITSKIDFDFLGFFINDENFWLKNGTGQPFVLFSQTFARPLLLPSLKEQTAIATVLSDMDAELAALEARRDKTRNLKKAMMQELLTGRTRLHTTGGSNG